MREQISQAAIDFARLALRHRLYSAVMQELAHQCAFHGMDVEKLAELLGNVEDLSDPHFLDEILERPSDWTLDTVSDILLALRCELDASIKPYRVETEPLIPQHQVEP